MIWLLALGLVTTLLVSAFVGPSMGLVVWLVVVACFLLFVSAGER
jgi:hypothetical protein